MIRRFFSGNDVDEEVEHIGFCKGGGDVGALEGAALVLLGVDPGAHGKLCDEDVAALGEQDGRFGADHFDVWIGFHDLLDAGQRKVVHLVVMRLVFQLLDGLLPVCGENVTILTAQTLSIGFQY